MTRAGVVADAVGITLLGYASFLMESPGRGVGAGYNGGSAGGDRPDSGRYAVSNLRTNVRDWQGGMERYGNSILVFEGAAHLSHLHHLLAEQDLVLLGHVDVVMATVDGVYTTSQAGHGDGAGADAPRLVLLMHWFTREVVGRFVELVRGRH